MKKSINDIVGSEILEYEKIWDYVQIITDKGTINLYNPVNFYLKNGEAIEIKEALSNILNCVITNLIILPNKYFGIEISNNVVIRVSLEDNDYSGPEAACINFENGGTVVVSE